MCVKGTFEYKLKGLCVRLSIVFIMFSNGKTLMLILVIYNMMLILVIYDIFKNIFVKKT